MDLYDNLITIIIEEFWNSVVKSARGMQKISSAKETCIHVTYICLECISREKKDIYDQNLYKTSQVFCFAVTGLHEKLLLHRDMSNQ